MQHPPFTQSTLTLASSSALNAIALQHVYATDSADDAPPAEEENTYTAVEETASEQSGVGVAHFDEQEAGEAESKVHRGTAEWVSLGEDKNDKLFRWCDSDYFNRGITPSRQAREAATAFLLLTPSQRIEALRLVATAPIGKLQVHAGCPQQDVDFCDLMAVYRDWQYMNELQIEAKPLKHLSLAESFRALQSRLVLHTLGAVHATPEEDWKC